MRFFQLHSSKNKSIYEAGWIYSLWHKSVDSDIALFLKKYNF